MLILLAACVRVPVVPAAALPAPPPPVAAEVCWVEYARGEGPAEFATRGPTETERLRGTVSGLLVRHPQGAVLVDVGNSADFLDHLDGYGAIQELLVRQLPGRMRRVATIDGALAFVGVESEQVRTVIGSHAHLDHVGGAAGLPGVPILLAEAELPYVRAMVERRSVALLPDQAQEVAGRMQGVTFDGPPVGPFPASHDLYGDGAVVLVPMPGHTPGSLGTLIRVAGLPPILHIGDVTMLVEGFERPAPKGMIVRLLDDDYRGTAEQIGNVHALHEGSPELVVLPAHDRDAWQGLFGGEPRCIGGSAPATVAR